MRARGRTCRPLTMTGSGSHGYSGTSPPRAAPRATRPGRRVRASSAQAFASTRSSIRRKPVQSDVALRQPSVGVSELPDNLQTDVASRSNPNRACRGLPDQPCPIVRVAPHAGRQGPAVLHSGPEGAVPVVLHFGFIGRGAHSRASPMGTYAPRPMMAPIADEWTSAEWMAGWASSGWRPRRRWTWGRCRSRRASAGGAGRCGLCPSTTGVLARSVRGSRQRARCRRGWRTCPPARTLARLMAELRATASAWPRRVKAA